MVAAGHNDKNFNGGMWKEQLWQEWDLLILTGEMQDHFKLTRTA